jgi:hypothetical protein
MGQQAHAHTCGMHMHHSGGAAGASKGRAFDQLDGTYTRGTQRVCRGLDEHDPPTQRIELLRQRRAKQEALGT